MAARFKLHEDWPYNILRLWRQSARTGIPHVLRTHGGAEEKLRFSVNPQFENEGFHEVRQITQGSRTEEVCLYVVKEYEGHPTLEASDCSTEEPQSGDDSPTGWCCLSGFPQAAGAGYQKVVNLSDLANLSAADLSRVAAYIRSGACKSIFVLAGAGVSTGAGIPDFRSAGGLYDSIRPELITASWFQRQRMRMDPTSVVERDMFFQNSFPYLEVRRPFILGTHQRKWKATISHWFMKFLEEERLLKRVFTQNIDGLDYQTGLSPSRVTNVHGSIARVSCEGCRKEMPFDDFCAEVSRKIKDIYGVDPEAPEESSEILCPGCHRPLVKPNTVLFGSSLPDEFFDRTDELAQADLLIVAGTSLVVGPANGVVQMVPEECLRVVVNKEQVGKDLGLDYSLHSRRDVWSGDRSCDETFLELIKLLGWQEKLRRVRHLLPEQSQELLRDF
mmetsp:Transcript_23419/g.44079  ORF Transcript_23419/g.44079 Transcript_23419/m.44079 type:complete len:446 (-) Transcript_23419:143-1480(-)